ncbi:MAG: hypothetical protein R3C59_10895 [Planctomycetaceae bacterium]
MIIRSLDFGRADITFATIINDSSRFSPNRGDFWFADFHDFIGSGNVICSPIAPNIPEFSYLRQLAKYEFAPERSFDDQLGALSLIAKS